jgi:hypothetical protein
MEKKRCNNNAAPNRSISNENHGIESNPDRGYDMENAGNGGMSQYGLG